MLILARRVWLALLACIMARPAAAIVAGAKMGLFTNNFTPGPDALLTDFTEAAWTGYAQQLTTITGPYSDAQGNLFMDAADVIWTGADAPILAYGFFLVDGGGLYVGAGRFDTPRQLLLPTDAFIVGGDFTFNPQESLGTASVEP